MRPKTKHRLILISIVAVVLLILGAAAWLILSHQNDAQLDALRAEGLKDFKQGDYIGTLAALKQYVGKRKDDAEALYAYAKARSNVIEANGKNLFEGVAAYRRYLTMRPGDDVARHEMLDLFFRAGSLNTEAMQTADELLAKDPNDAAAIRARAFALFRFKKYDDAFVPATKYNTLKPDDLEGIQLTYFIMIGQGKKSQDLVDWAEAYRKAHPDNPRCDLVQAYAYMFAYDRDRTKDLLPKIDALLDKAAAKDVQDPQYITAVTDKLDERGNYTKSLEVLRRAAQKGNDPQMMLLLVQRLWQTHQPEQVIALLTDLSPADNKANSNLLAYKALAFCSLKKSADAKPIIDALAQRNDDGQAVAWAMTLKTRYFDELAPRAAIDQYLQASTRDKDNMVVAYLIGESYSQLGENELAIQYWKKVVERMPSWDTPRVRMAQLYGNTGRVGSALDAAADAWKQSHNVSTAVNLATAWFRNVEDTGDTSDLDNLLKFVTELQKQYPGEETTLPIYAALLVKTGKTDEAKAVLQKILDTPADKLKLGEETMIRLASVSRAGGLGMDAALIDASQKMHGMTPRLALNRAAALYAAGKSDEALAFLTKAADDGGHTSQWDLAVAQFREVTRSAGAREAWIKLADANENDLAIQTAALDATSTWQDRLFIQRTFERVRKLTGDEGITWKLARARWLLGSENKDKDTAEAVVKLSEIVREFETLAKPRLLYAAALENSGNYAGALDQLRAAAKFNPQNVDIGIRLVQRLQFMGKYDEAREQLNHLAALPNMNSEQRTRVAAYFAQQGLASRGADVLEGAGNGDDPMRDAILAELRRRQGRIAAAEAIYKKLLALPSPPPEVLISAADFYAIRGDQAQVDQILSRIALAKTEPGKREMLLGTFYEQYGSRDKAAENYLAATKAASADERTWQALLGFYLRNRRLDDLVAASAQAATALPGSAVVESMKHAGDVFKANASRTDLQVLADTISRDPTVPGVRDTLDAIEEARRIGMGPEQFAGRMKQLADRYPQFLPVHLLLVDAYRQCGRLGDATNAAARIVENFPTSPEATQVTVNVYAAAQRNDEMLITAKRWRDRSLERPLLADLAIAEAYMRLNRPNEAVKALQAYVEPGKANPDALAEPLTAYCRALIKAGRADEAANILLPLAQKSPAWRVRWLNAGAVTQKDFAAAKSWLERMTPFVTDAPTERYALAEAWFNAGVTFHAKEGFERARDTVKPLLDGKDVKPDYPLLYGAASEQAGDFSNAEAGYRAALKLDPNLPVALNNLAYVLLNKGGDLTEATDLAKKATATKNAPATYFDTLARILLKANQRADALAAFEAALQRDPKAVEAMIGRASVLAQDGNTKEAKAMLDQIDTYLTNPDSLSPALKAELESVRGALKTNAAKTDNGPVVR